MEWQPLVGAVPPLTDQDWLVLFEKYRRTPEYEQVNRGMDMAGFKGMRSHRPFMGPSPTGC